MDFLANLKPGGWVILGIFLLMIIGVVVSFLRKKKKKSKVYG
jgi:LPXTG-motif cell wall-anchored protein